MLPYRQNPLHAREQRRSDLPERLGAGEPNESNEPTEHRRHLAGQDHETLQAWVFTAFW